MLTLFAEEKKNGNKGLEKVRTDGEKEENRKFSIFERTERRKMGPAKWPNKARAYKKELLKWGEGDHPRENSFRNRRMDENNNRKRE